MEVVFGGLSVSSESGFSERFSRLRVIGSNSPTTSSKSLISRSNFGTSLCQLFALRMKARMLCARVMRPTTLAAADTPSMAAWVGDKNRRLCGVGKNGMRFPFHFK